MTVTRKSLKAAIGTYLRSIQNEVIRQFAELFVRMTVSVQGTVQFRAHLTYGGLVEIISIQNLQCPPTKSKLKSSDFTFHEYESLSRHKKSRSNVRSFRQLHIDQELARAVVLAYKN